MVPTVEGSDFWTFALVEEKMIEAWGFLMRLPDRERGWMASSARSSMPAVVRSNRDGDYFETQQGRPGLRSHEVTLVERALIGEGAWIEWVPTRDRELVATVLTVKGWHVSGGFAWSDVAEEMAWVAGPDALRMRYNRAVSRIAARLDKGRVAVF